MAWGASLGVVLRRQGGQGAGMRCVSGSGSKRPGPCQGQGRGGGCVVTVVCDTGAHMLLPGVCVWGSLCTNPQRLIRPQDCALKTCQVRPRLALAPC